MATGQNIADRLDLLFAEYASDMTPANQLVLVNMAVAAAWPKAKRSLFVESSATTPATVSNATFVYQVNPQASTTIPPWGIGQVWVTPLSTREDIGPLHDVTQYNKDGTWYLRFTREWAYEYNGEAIKVMYQTEPAQLSALSGTLPIDADFCLAHAALSFCERMYMLAEQPFAQVMANGIAHWRDKAERSYRRMPTTPALGLPIATHWAY